MLNQDGQIGALDVEMLAVHKFLCMMKGHKSLIKHTNRVHLSFQFQIKHSEYKATLPSNVSCKSQQNLGSVRPWVTWFFVPVKVCVFYISNFSHDAQILLIMNTQFSNPASFEICIARGHKVEVFVRRTQIFAKSPP